MNILFLHNAFPGPYRHIAPFVARQDGARVMVATLSSNPQEIDFDHLRYTPYRDASPKVHHMLAPAENAVLLAHATYDRLHHIRLEGYRPDLICAHGGSGPAHFMKDLWPSSRLLVWHDWFCRGLGSHADFLGPITEDQQGRLRMRNAPTLIDLAAQDWGTVPTCFQLSQFPHHLQGGLSVLHEGIDTGFFCPAEERIGFRDRLFTAEQEIITFAQSGLDPFGGFPQFMAAVARLQKKRPGLLAIIAGTDVVGQALDPDLGQNDASRGAPRREGLSWREEALATLDLDLSRLFFVGPVPPEGLRALFRITRAHIHLAAPFALSPLLMEAMATGAPVVGSRTGPVEEMIGHEREGLLIDFFDVEAQVEAIARLLDDRDLRRRLGDAARARMVAEYDQALLAHRHWDLMQAVASGELSASNEVLTLSDLSFDETSDEAWGARAG